MANLLPHSIANAGHIGQLDQTAQQRLSAIPIGDLMAYFIDTCSPKMLPYLAEQFGVSGERGYAFATTDEQRRDLIKSAIAIKRYKGTTYAIKQVMSDLGFGSATLNERAGTVGDGRDWARFSISVQLQNQPFTPTTQDQLVKLVLLYKNARSFLINSAVTYTFGFEDTIPLPTDDLAVSLGSQITDNLFTGGLKYDGSKKYDGSAKYRSGIEQMNVTII